MVEQLSGGGLRLLAKWMGQNSRTLTALFFALLAVLGMARAPFAAPGLDDGPERRILALNIRAYAAFFGQADAPFFAGLPEGEIAADIERDHGQARLYPVWPLINALERAGRPGAASAVLYGYCHLLFLLGAFGVYAILHRLAGSRAAGVLGALLLASTPPLYASSFYNTKDTALLSLCLITFWLGLRFWEGGGFGSAVWFGLAGAFAFNSRLLGAAAFGLMGLGYLALLTLQKRWSARAFWRGAAAVGAFAGFWLLLTPAAWAGPLEFLRYQLSATSSFDAARWGGWVLYRGAAYNAQQNPIPWHYVPWLMLITTPLLVLALAAAWPVLLAVKNGRRAAGWQSAETVVTALLALFFALPVGYAMLRRPNLYNGWRHLYFVYGSIVLYAGLAAARLWQLAKGAAPGRRRALCGLLAAALAAHLGYYGGFSAYNGINSCGYFNLLAGASPEERYEADYWNIGLRGVMEEMQKRDPAFSAVPLTPATRISASWYGIQNLLPPMAEGCEEVAWNRRGRARYVVENVSCSAADALHPSWDEADPAVAEWRRGMAGQQPVYELRCGRAVLWRVYQNPQYNGPSPETRAQPGG